MSLHSENPPVAKTIPVTTVVHGDERVDEYAWLRDKADPAVMAYLRAEDAHASEAMRSTEGLQQALYDEMLARIQETDLSVPWRKSGWLWFGRTEKGKQYPYLCRRADAPDAPDQVVLDMNSMAEGQGYLAIGAYEPSDDGNLLLFSTDTTGFREYTLRVKDLRTGSILPFHRDKVSSATWAADGRTFFYVTDDPAKRPHRLWRHVLGDEGDDTLVHEEEDERFNLSIGRTRSGTFLLRSADSHTQSEVAVLEASNPTGAFRTIEPRAPDLEYEVDHGADLFYIRVNDRGRNFRLVTAPVASPSRAHWTELIPHRADTMLWAVEVFAGHYVVFEKSGGLDRIRVVSLATATSHEIGFPEPAYAVYPDANPEFDATKFRFRYQSPITPASVFDEDMTTRERVLLKETPVLGGYDRTRYAVERLHASAPDGTRVPITLAYRKDEPRPKDGPRPVHLVGYGSYGFPLPATFSSNRISLMDRGIVCALAHVRGGGEMGKPWHDDGRMMKKKNTFTDFIAVAEHLVREGRTSPDRLVIEGGSAGGLLLGAVVNMRPDLFKAVVSKVPFVDVVNTMLDETLPLTVAEFEEWGNPKVEADFRYIASYCPYTNLRRASYPTMLIKTSTEDSQVMFWEPAKYVAKLRTLKTDSNPVLFKINFSAGHGGSSGRYDALREVAFDYAFILATLGLDRS